MINIPTLEQLNELPRLNDTENIRPEDKMVHVHFQIGQCHWWAIEWDGQDTFFGFVLMNGWSHGAEFGYFTLSELKEVKVEGWLEVVHDPFWNPRPAKDVWLIRDSLYFQAIQHD